MSDNLTNLSEKDEKGFWIKRILDLRAYLEQEQEANKAIYENYEKAQADLSNGIELGTQLCLDLKAQYLQRIEELNKEISRLQYQASQEIHKLRHATKSSHS